MGADLVGFRGCPLQQQLGSEGFLRKLKLLAYKRAADQAVPDQERRERLKLRVSAGDGSPLTTSYPELRREIEGFESGIPECATCPISGHRALGCYEYVSYPIDEAFEEAAFAFVVESLGLPDSIGDRFYREVILRFDDEPTEWVERRGLDTAGALCARSEPLEHVWTEDGEERRLRSADVLAALFVTILDPEDLALYRDLLSGLADLLVRQSGGERLTGTSAELLGVARLIHALATPSSETRRLIVSA